MHLVFKLFVYSMIAVSTLTAAWAGQIDATAFDPSKRTEVSFSTLPFSFGRPGAVFADGITFTSGFGSFRTYPFGTSTSIGSAVNVCAEKGCIMTDSELDFIAVTLPTPVSLVGAYLGIPNVATTATAEFYSGTSLLGVVNISAQPFEGVFAGWDAGGAFITSVKFIDTEYQSFALGLSGFTYQVASSVPELSTVIQLSLGILVIGWASRRHKYR